MTLGWVGEKAGRQKTSPLGLLLEVEAMRLGAEGKVSMWLAAADQPSALDEPELSRMAERGRRQGDGESMRVGLARDRLAADG